MSMDPYVYPGTSILRNKLGIRNAAKLDLHERELVLERASQTLPSGDFDLAHLRALHRHLFQDVYDWAGELRTVEISKGGAQFQLRRFIETGMADVHRRLVKADHLRGRAAADFAAEAGRIVGDVNYVHPFRDGNGRAQLLYLKQLAARAGHVLDLTRLDREGWIAASQAAHLADYAPMARCLAKALR